MCEMNTGIKEYDMQKEIQDSICQFQRTFRFVMIGILLAAFFAICDVALLAVALNICEFSGLMRALCAAALIFTVVFAVALVCAVSQFFDEHIMLTLLVKEVEEWPLDRSGMEVRQRMLRRCRAKLKEIESLLRFVDIICVPLFIAVLGVCYILFK